MPDPTRSTEDPREGAPWLLGVRLPPWLKRIGRLLGVAIVALCLYYLGQRLAAGLREAPLRAFRPIAWPIIVSVGLTTLSVGAGGWAWQRLLAALGYSLPPLSCLGIQTTANLAKYVPGYAWQLLGKAYLTRREGVPNGVIGWALLLEMGCLLLTGLGLALVFMPAGTPLPLIGALPGAVRWMATGLVWLFICLLPVALRAVGTWKHKASWLIPLARPTALWGALAVLVLSWLLLGAAFGYLVRAYQPVPVRDWLLSVYTLVASFLVSLVTLFVPAGLGVRESVMAATLGARLPGGLPVVVAVLSRLALTISELAAFALARLGLFLARHNRSITRKD